MERSISSMSCKITQKSKISLKTSFRQGKIYIHNINNSLYIKKKYLHHIIQYTSTSIIQHICNTIQKKSKKQKFNQQNQSEFRKVLSLFLIIDENKIIINKNNVTHIIHIPNDNYQYFRICVGSSNLTDIKSKNAVIKVSKKHINIDNCTSICPYQAIADRNKLLGKMLQNKEQRTIKFNWNQSQNNQLQQNKLQNQKYSAPKSFRSKKINSLVEDKSKQKHDSLLNGKFVAVENRFMNVNRKLAINPSFEGVMKMNKINENQYIRGNSSSAFKSLREMNDYFMMSEGQRKQSIRQKQNLRSFWLQSKKNKKQAQINTQEQTLLIKNRYINKISSQGITILGVNNESTYSNAQGQSIPQKTTTNISQQLRQNMKQVISENNNECTIIKKQEIYQIQDIDKKNISTDHKFKEEAKNIQEMKIQVCLETNSN